MSTQYQRFIRSTRCKNLRVAAFITIIVRALRVGIYRVGSVRKVQAAIGYATTAPG